MNVDVPPGQGSGTDDWAMLLDPAWQPRFPDEKPPIEAMAGGWPLDDEGNPGKFEPNPGFVPSAPTSPTDPIDAVLRLVADGQAPVDEVIPTVRDAMLEVAVSEDGYPLIGPAPDGAPCAAVATAPFHRQRIASVEHWGTVTAEQLLELLPSNTDILLNPGGPGSMRLLASALRDSYTPNRNDK